MEVITDINQLDPNGTYSYADYMKWRIDEYVELFRGKIKRMSPAPLREHQRISRRITTRVDNYLEGKKCEVYSAPFDVRLPKKKASADEKIYTVVQPDVCIICDPAKLDRRGCIGAPDTVIEILSQGNLDRDVKQKFSLYEEHGVPEYWIVAPGIQTISVYQLSPEARYELSGEYDGAGNIPIASLPGFFLPWEDIFDEEQ